MGGRIARAAGRWSALLGAVLCLVDPATAQELRIITSYQEEVVEPMIEAFARRHPDIRVRVLNKNTPAAVSEMIAGNQRRFDLFWASAPEAFVVLDEAGRLLDQGRGPTRILPCRHLDGPGMFPAMICFPRIGTICSIRLSQDRSQCRTPCARGLCIRSWRLSCSSEAGRKDGHGSYNLQVS